MALWLISAPVAVTTARAGHQGTHTGSWALEGPGVFTAGEQAWPGRDSDPCPQGPRAAGSCSALRGKNSKTLGWPEGGSRVPGGRGSSWGSSRCPQNVQPSGWERRDRVPAPPGTSRGWPRRKVAGSVPRRGRGGSPALPPARPGPALRTSHRWAPSLARPLPGHPAAPPRVHGARHLLCLCGAAPASIVSAAARGAGRGAAGRGSAVRPATGAGAGAGAGARAAPPRRLARPKAGARCARRAGGRAVRTGTAPREGDARGGRCHSCRPHHTPCPPRARTHAAPGGLGTRSQQPNPTQPNRAPRGGLLAPGAQAQWGHGAHGERGRSHAQVLSTQTCSRAACHPCPPRAPSARPPSVRPHPRYPGWLEALCPAPGLRDGEAEGVWGGRASSPTQSCPFTPPHPGVWGPPVPRTK